MRQHLNEKATFCYYFLLINRRNYLTKNRNITTKMVTWCRFLIFMLSHSKRKIVVFFNFSPSIPGLVIFKQFFSQYPRQAPLENMLCIDFEMIGIANPQWGHHVMLDFPIEVGIVDSNLNTVYHRRCRPDFLPQTGKLSGKHFKKLYSPPIDRTLDRPSIDLRTWITGIRPGDLDFQVEKLVDKPFIFFLASSIAGPCRSSSNNSRQISRRAFNRARFVCSPAFRSARTGSSRHQPVSSMGKLTSCQNSLFL